MTPGRQVVGGRVQREGDVVHIVATRLHDGSDLLASVGDRGDTFPIPHGRGYEVCHGSRSNPRSPKVRDIYIPDLSLEAIKDRTRDFRWPIEIRVSLEPQEPA